MSRAIPKGTPFVMLPVDDPSAPLLIDAALAIGIGLFVGLEREHSDVTAHPYPEGETGARAHFRGQLLDGPHSASSVG